MVRKQRRMTVKKKSSKKVGNVASRKAGTARPKSTKARPGRPKGKPKAKADRANTALKTLMKALQNQTEDQE